ncbi:hypothetical protein [Burkholderia lata]|uniref:hypothetical protein n=1 Tax=Burkholderia lata (strain ATCC 17760 / DSM 23089 / LMG 22485 / NCIMB 9086 / R18194 / 383) TaxID=482957 RepID=UPI001581D26D|nr:hypothetical protein [Burkholderia lata]
MTIQLVGTYVSEDGQHTLKVTESTPSNGRFSGIFTAKNTPEGEVSYKIVNGDAARWYYTLRNASNDFAGIGFMVAERPGDARFVLVDSWAGSLNNAGALLMSGSRSYTTNAGDRQVFSFGNVKFIKQK